MKYLCCAVGLVVLNGCRPPVDILEYDQDRDQIIFLYHPIQPQQVFYSERGGDTPWSATSSSALELPPPSSGPWNLRFDDWTMVFARDGQLLAEKSDCTIDFMSARARASMFTVGSCAADRGICCRNGEQLVVGRESSCRVLSSWGQDDALCVLRGP